MPTTERLCPDYRQKYRNLKRKLKILIYENECFQEELKKAQRKLLKVARDKSFLLDRLLQFEVVESSTSDSEATVSSDSETELKAEVLAIKKKKTTANVEKEESTNVSAGTSTATTDSKKKKSRKAPAVKPALQPSVPISSMIIDPITVPHVDGHMTSEEIERHLESKQALRDLMPEKTPLTVPVELFSNDPGLEWISSFLIQNAERIPRSDLNGQINESSPNIVEGVSEDDGLIIDLHD